VRDMRLPEQEPGQEIEVATVGVFAPSGRGSPTPPVPIVTKSCFCMVGEPSRSRPSESWTIGRSQRA
jgi:hypothetical protein